MVQGELALENQLIKQLTTIGYSSVEVQSEESLLANLKAQIEKRKNTSLSDLEFKKVLNILNKGTIFEELKHLEDNKE